MPDARAAERIECAAVRVRGATEPFSLPQPARHHDVLHHMLACGMPRDRINKAEQGFLTVAGWFVDRQEAWHIAETAGQLVRQPSLPGTLFSEDVW